MNMRSWAAFLPVLLVASMACGEPFDPGWNWENQKVYGKVKRIATESPREKKFEEFNAKGQKIKIQRFNELGKSLSDAKLEYNDSKDLYKITLSRKGFEKPVYVEEAEYKGKGIIETVVRIIGDKVMRSETFVYNEKKHLKEISLRTGAQLTTWVFTFNDAKDLTAFELKQDGKVSIRAVYEKHEKGNAAIIKSFRDGKPSSEAEVTYEYDKHGNWTTRTVRPILFRNDKAVKKDVHVTRRKIEYYN
ncbi:hypothetical protein ACFL01_02220 [Planctomycetota bacterium]